MNTSHAGRGQRHRIWFFGFFVLFGVGAIGACASSGAPTESGLGGQGGETPSSGGTGSFGGASSGGAKSSGGTFGSGGGLVRSPFEYRNFEREDDRGFADEDFSPGHVKGQCALGRGMTGLSFDPKCGGPVVLQCETGRAEGKPLASVNPFCGDERRDETTGDWDFGYRKGECGMSEAIVGVARDERGGVHDLLCASSTKPTAGTCTVRNAVGGDNRGRATTEDWSSENVKVECAPGEFVKGVSLVPESRRVHALLCCSGEGETSVAFETKAETGDFENACRPLGTTKTMTVFDKAHLHGGQRNVYASADFPTEGSYEKITLSFSLSCPGGGCDPWDRWGNVGIVTKKGDNPDGDEMLELARFVTPYGVGGTFTFDMTELRPILEGKLDLRVFIDTWVDGWLATAKFDFVAGRPAREVAFVRPLWANSHVSVGNPSDPIENRVPSRTIEVPSAVCDVGVRAHITGHGQGNSDNCAEFCAKKHYFEVAGKSHGQTVWRNDCATTAVQNQNGTWQYDRAGWCPGAGVRPLVVNASGDLSRGQLERKESFVVSYDVEGYDNQCRPDNCTTSTCVFGTGCAYNGGSHTDPFYSLTALLVGYR